MANFTFLAIKMRFIYIIHFICSLSYALSKLLRKSKVWVHIGVSKKKIKKIMRPNVTMFCIFLRLFYCKINRPHFPNPLGQVLRFFQTVSLYSRHTCIIMKQEWENFSQKDFFLHIHTIHRTQSINEYGMKMLLFIIKTPTSPISTDCSRAVGTMLYTIYPSKTLPPV